MSARTYACPSCGAQVEEHLRRCHYCDAPVATVRCAACFHMNVQDAGYCSGCGSQLGLEPVGEAGDLPCPLCKTPLGAYREGASALFDCDRCGGQFVEHALLHTLIERHAHPAARVVGGPPPRAIARPKLRAGYIPCPACSALMNRKNFGNVSGVIVDVCKKHGTWFELGELPRVLAFVAAGGLERSRQREEEEAAAHAQRERLAAAAAAGEPHVPMSARDPLFAAHVGSSLAKMLVDLLRG